MDVSSIQGMSELNEALEGLTLETRDERLKQHCVANTQALLYRAEPLKDVCFKCSDDEFVFAHKFILGTQCQCASHASLPPFSCRQTQSQVAHDPSPNMVFLCMFSVQADLHTLCMQMHMTRTTCVTPHP